MSFFKAAKFVPPTEVKPLEFAVQPQPVKKKTKVQNRLHFRKM